MSAKAPGAGEAGERMDNLWTTVDPDSEIKLVRVSEGTFRARFLCEIRVLGWFLYLCMGFPRSILKVLS
jgi:hypothetical protein